MADKVLAVFHVDSKIARRLSYSRMGKILVAEVRNAQYRVREANGMAQLSLQAPSILYWLLAGLQHSSKQTSVDRENFSMVYAFILCVEQCGAWEFEGKDSMGDSWDFGLAGLQQGIKDASPVNLPLDRLQHFDMKDGLSELKFLSQTPFLDGYWAQRMCQAARDLENMLQTCRDHRRKRARSR